MRQANDPAEGRARYGLTVVPALAEEASPTIGWGEYYRAWRKDLRRTAKLWGIALASAMVLTIAVLHLLPTRYMAHMTVTPDRALSETDTNNLALSNLTSLVGLNDRTDDNFNVYLRTRTSTVLAKKLMAVPGLAQHIFRDQWDPATKTWHPAPGILPAIERGLRTVFGFRAWRPPTADDLATYIDRWVNVAVDRRTQITDISYVDRDPQFAASFLDDIHRDTEDLLRTQAEMRTHAMIDHLTAELATVTVAEHRAVLSDLLSGSEKRLMLLDPRLPYAAIVIDPPTADLTPIAPKPLLTLFLVAVGMSILVLFGSLWQTGRRLRRQRNEHDAGGVTA